jgi:hypothetical protein
VKIMSIIFLVISEPDCLNTPDPYAKQNEKCCGNTECNILVKSDGQETTPLLPAIVLVKLYYYYQHKLIKLRHL